MVSIVGETTGEHIVVDALEPIGGFRRRLQAERTLNGGVVVIDYGEDIAGTEFTIEVREIEAETTLRKMDRISRENGSVTVSMDCGYFRGVPRSSDNGRIVIVITERCA